MAAIEKGLSSGELDVMNNYYTLSCETRERLDSYHGVDDDDDDDDDDDGGARTPY